MMNPDGLSPEALKRLEAMPDGRGPDPDPDFDDHAAVADWRATAHEAWGEGPVGGEVTHRPETVAGVPCLVAGPEASSGPWADSVTIMHLHAGGYCLGSPGIDVPITSRLARRFHVVSVDYRLAPEHPYPAALDEAERVFRALTATGPVIISGVSAGGGLAIGVAGRCPESPPVGLVLLCPHLDFGASTGRELVGYERAYLAGHPADDAEVSPADGPVSRLAALPPILTQASTTEHLYASIERFGTAATEAGAEVVWQVWDGLWHAWHYHRELPEAWAAMDEVTDWVESLADEVGSAVTGP